MKKYFIIALVVIIIGGMAAGIAVLQIQVNTLQKDVHQLETSLYGPLPSLPSLGGPSIKDQLDACKDEIDEYGQLSDDLEGTMAQLENQMNWLTGTMSQDVSQLLDIAEILDDLVQRMNDVEWDIFLLNYS